MRIEFEIRSKELLDELCTISDELYDLKVVAKELDKDIRDEMEQIDNYVLEHESYDRLYGLHVCVKDVINIDIDSRVDQLENYIKD